MQIVLAFAGYHVGCVNRAKFFSLLVGGSRGGFVYRILIFVPMMDAKLDHLCGTAITTTITRNRTDFFFAPTIC